MLVVEFSCDDEVEPAGDMLVSTVDDCVDCLGREVGDGVSFPTKCSAATEALDTKTMDTAGSDSSWEAFVGKMACKGELLGLDREEQIVVKQQMLDRLMLLERELQERTGVSTHCVTLTSNRTVKYLTQ